MHEQNVAKQNLTFTLESNDDKQRRLKETHTTRRAEAQQTLRDCRGEKMTYDKQRMVNTSKISLQEIAAKQLDQKVRECCVCVRVKFV